MTDELKRDKEDVIYTRSAKRIDIELEVSFEVVEGGPHNFYTGITQDISHGGIFLGTHQTMPLGHKMQLTFILEGREIAARAEVVWVREPDMTASGIQPGMGLRFIEIAEADRKFIEDYAAQRETIYYDDDK
ncbi:MAG TPA: PilZ domain-containing protein [bacterium]|nr:PilZ domain-containing protein [bacterium]